MANLNKLVFIDLETTGANPISDRITEIGIVCVENGEVSRWSSLVNPGAPIPPFIQNLTGISDAMVQDAPSFQSLVPDIIAYLEGGLFIAHNARFDHGFMRNALKAAGHTLDNQVLCSVKLSRKLFPQHARHNLDSIMERHGLIAEARHRALADADLLWQFWQIIHAEIDPDTLAQAIKSLLHQPACAGNLDHAMLAGIPDTPGVYLFYGDNAQPLYVGKSLHLRRRVQSHFSADQRSQKGMPSSQQIKRVEWRETAGEIGALLLEAKLIKELQPSHNRAPRRQRGLCAWRLRKNERGISQAVLAYAHELDFGQVDGLYGLYSSSKKADAALRALAAEHGLCVFMLGLEAGEVNEEDSAQHEARLEAAFANLKLQPWPFPGAVGMIEYSPDGTRQDLHVVNNWCCLGTVSSEEAARELLQSSPARPGFERDTYTLLRRALALGLVTVQTL
jgi:DNA polymerase-3 subunit epsilon